MSLTAACLTMFLILSGRANALNALVSLQSALFDLVSFGFDVDNILLCHEELFRPSRI